MHIGIFGGSFDPIHHGHLILARTAREQLQLDSILFIPTNLSPHKNHSNPASAQARLDMLKLALADEPHSEISDIETLRPPPSFTIDTLRHLIKLRPTDQFTLLIGADNVEKFSTWREADSIPRLARIAVLERAANLATPPHSWSVIRRFIDISSTNIRHRVAHNQSIRYLTTDAVCAYIMQNRLYLNE